MCICEGRALQQQMLPSSDTCNSVDYLQLAACLRCASSEKASLRVSHSSLYKLIYSNVHVECRRWTHEFVAHKARYTDGAAAAHLTEHVLSCAVDIQDNSMATLDNPGVSLFEALSSLANIVTDNSQDLHSNGFSSLNSIRQRASWSFREFTMVTVDLRAPLSYFRW